VENGTNLKLVGQNWRGYSAKRSPLRAGPRRPALKSEKAAGPLGWTGSSEGHIGLGSKRKKSGADLTNYRRRRKPNYGKENIVKSGTILGAKGRGDREVLK